MHQPKLGNEKLMFTEYFMFNLPWLDPSDKHDKSSTVILYLRVMTLGAVCAFKIKS